MNKQQRTTQEQALASIELELLVLDKESLKDLDPSTEQQVAVKTGAVACTLRTNCDD